MLLRMCSCFNASHTGLRRPPLLLLVQLLHRCKLTCNKPSSRAVRPRKLWGLYRLGMGGFCRGVQ